ncbi:MAG: hypothetical protein HQ583_00640 [Candidatus Abyssubacteria bacterium]|nr:hypothetical protein [Candidatus Abyssubacteria bacterium]
MRKKTVFALWVTSLLIGGVMIPAFAAETDNAISRIKLTPESIPPGMEVATEIQASKRQLFRTRLKIGFPLKALLNQTIIYSTHQAKVNYMDLPDESWFDFGYTKLVGAEGYGSLVVAKDNVIIQIAANTKDLENWLLRLLRVDMLQTQKIRIHRTPSGWVLTNERFLRTEDLRGLEQEAAGLIRRGIMQQFLIVRKSAKITYYDCGTEETAEIVGQSLADKKGTINKRSVRALGATVVVADSPSLELNENVLAYVNW